MYNYYNKCVSRFGTLKKKRYNFLDHTTTIILLYYYGAHAYGVYHRQEIHNRVLRELYYTLYAATASKTMTTTINYYNCGH